MIGEIMVKTPIAITIAATMGWMMRKTIPKRINAQGFQKMIECNFAL
jgi:hypothetical protein